MRIVTRYLLCAVTGASILASSSAGASAAIACANDVCWHIHKTYHYPPAAHVVVHPDGWHWGPKVIIRDHAGRGYWRGDHWVGW
jgi:hypothetical protein